MSTTRAGTRPAIVTNKLRNTLFTLSSIMAAIAALNISTNTFRNTFFLHVLPGCPDRCTRIRLHCLPDLFRQEQKKKAGAGTTEGFPEYFHLFQTIIG